MKYFKYLLVAFSVAFLFIGVFTSQSSAQNNNTLSCKVHTYLVPEGYQLPYRYDTREIAANSYLNSGDNIVYTFEVNSGTNPRKSITKVTASHVTSGNEPIDILAVRPQNGSCAINPDTKAITCNTNYSFVESASGAIEYLFNVRSSKTQPSTSTSFYVETTEGATSCIGYHFVREAKIVNPVDWRTQFASLKASDFHIEIGDKVFYGNDTMRLVSDPGVDRTTLEATWQENGVEMRLFMYFRKTSTNDWEMYELRTYNGQQPGDWLYYSDSLGNSVSSMVGQRNYSDERTFVASSGNAKIYCKGCDINAFMPKPISVSPHGYSLEALIGLQPGEIITIPASQNIGYGVNVILRDSAGNVVMDQENLVYEWTVANPNIASVATGNIEYSNGQCAYGMYAPCPNINGQIAGLSRGQTTITVSVVRSTNNVKLASVSFPVKVTSDQEETSPSTEVDQIKELREEIDQLNQRVDDQQNIIERLNAQIEALRQLIGQFFRNLFRR